MLLGFGPGQFPTSRFGGAGRCAGFLWFSLIHFLTLSSSLPVFPFLAAHSSAPSDCGPSAGYTPLATCSPASAALVRDYGASHTFAYTSPSCADDIRAAVAAPLRYALDCITDAESARTCYAALGRTGGRYVSLEACRSEWKTRKAVKGEFVMGYEIFGKEVALGGEYGRRADEGKKERAVKWCREVQGLVKEGKIRSHPVRVLEDGWEGVLEGLRRLRSGEVRREKLVVRVEGEENEVEGEGYNQD